MEPSKFIPRMCTGTVTSHTCVKDGCSSIILCQIPAEIGSQQPLVREDNNVSQKSEEMHGNMQ